MLTPFSVVAPSGHALFGLVARPTASLLPGRAVRPRPLVVLLPGGVGAGRVMARGPVGRALYEAGFVVASFNAHGRTHGFGDRRSGGTEDFGGPADQDGLAAVVRHLVSLPGVDPDHVGLATVSMGLVAAAGAMHRHPDLPIRWIVDEEGPADAWSAMLAGWRLHDLGERPDRSRKAVTLFGHDLPTPGSASERFWAPRTPVVLLRGFRGAYLRLQAELDHVQPPGEPAHVPHFQRPPDWWQGRHAMQVVEALVAGGCPWVRVNLPGQRNPVNATYTLDRPPRWLPGRMTDHPRAMVEGVIEMSRLGRG